MYDLEGINSAKSETLRNVELSESTRDYFKEVIPGEEEWKQMSDSEKGSSLHLIESRIQEVCELTGIREADVSKHIPQYIFGRVEHTELPYCDEDEYSTRSVWAVNEFWENEKYRETPYVYADLDLRTAYMEDFYDNFAEFSGYNSKLVFRDLDPRNMGAYNPEDNTITLNSRLLWQDNPEELMKTVLHESRHVYQQYAVDHPDKVSVSEEKLSIWQENVDNYIPAEFDYEEYVNQPIEVDAEEYANKVYNTGCSYLT